MKLYYTTSVSEDAFQDRPDLSLGGYKSSVAAPSDSYNNLFGNISCYSVQQDQHEYIALIVKNETGVDATNIRLWLEYPSDSQKTIEIAVVALNASNYMEHINNPYSAPLMATFYEADGEVNALDLPDILADGLLGFWFKKIIDKDAVKEPYTDDNIEANGNVEPSNEEISLIIGWT